MRARNASNFPCASCTVPVHTSCSGSLPGPSLANSFRLYSVVPTPVLLADVFSGVRIGEERRNVRGEGSYWRTREYLSNFIFLSRVFLDFFYFLLRRSSLFTPLFRCPFVQFSVFPIPGSLFFYEGLYASPSSSPTARGPCSWPLVSTFVYTLSR